MRRNSRTLRFKGLLAAALLAAGCTAPAATENPPGAGKTGATVVSVCYAPMVAAEAEILAAAVEACSAAGVANPAPDPWRRDTLWNDCPLFSKARASFICAPRRGVAEGDGP